MSTVVLLKSHVGGYSRKDGTYIAPHERKGVAAKPAIHHPRRNEKGDKVHIKRPHVASARSTWHSPEAIATFLPDGDAPMSLNGVALKPWTDHPTTNEGWDYLDLINDDIDEPEMDVPEGKHAGSGIVIEEPDGRVWLVAPTNQFGGYNASFPKGTAEPDLSLQGNAIKEAFEESGLQVEITGLIGDFERTTSVARMYTGRRVGGTPTDAGWESQAVTLCPKDRMHEVLNMWSDHAVSEAIGGSVPSKAEDKNKQK